MQKEAWTSGWADQGRHDHKTTCCYGHYRPSGPLIYYRWLGSHYTGAVALLTSFPNAKWLLADRGHNADWFREAFSVRGTKPCILDRNSRKKVIRYDKRCYKRRSRIEGMFSRLNDWRRVATRYYRCPKVFLSAIALAATVIFRLCVPNLDSLLLFR